MWLITAIVKKKKRLTTEVRFVFEEEKILLVKYFGQRTKKREQDHTLLFHQKETLKTV